MYTQKYLLYFVILFHFFDKKNVTSILRAEITSYVLCFSITGLLLVYIQITSPAIQKWSTAEPKTGKQKQLTHPD